MKRTCFVASEVDFEPTLIQTGVDRFTVVYGKQVSKGLTYSEAARELGQCIMHGLACMGKLDNREVS